MGFRNVFIRSGGIPELTSGMLAVRRFQCNIVYGEADCK